MKTRMLGLTISQHPQQALAKLQDLHQSRIIDLQQVMHPSSTSGWNHRVLIGRETAVWWESLRKYDLNPSS